MTAYLDREIRRQAALAEQEAAAQLAATTFRPGLLQRRDQTKTLYDRHGRPFAQLRVHDTGNTETEYDNNQDATVRPKPVHATIGRDEYHRLLRRQGEIRHG